MESNIKKKKPVKPPMRPGNRWGGMVREVFEAVAAGKISHSDAYVYTCIARHADSKTKHAFPKQTTIWSYSGFDSLRSVERAIKALKRAGLIVVERGWSNHYFLPFHDLKKQDDNGENE